ncbi:MAG TPA: hypothetical protein VLL73_04555, partial [Desulfurivibrionaceae bacterium]|nr:hypothetical protein [Desulfurivibrionaceae bacterium]
MDHWERMRKGVPLLVGAVSVVVGGLVLLGWSLDIVAFRSLRPDWVAMKANTAVAFLLAGAAMFSLALPSSRSSLFLVRVWALLCGLIGLLSLGEYVFSWDPGFDQWLFFEQTGAVGTSHPGRLAPDTAACFVLLAAGWLLATGKGRGEMLRFWLTITLGALVVAMAMAAIGSYFRDAVALVGLWGLTLMAFHTALLFVFLGVATAVIAWPAGVSLWSLRGRTGLGFGFWTLMVVGWLMWGLHHQGYSVLNEAKAAARANINKDIAFRKWATSHGGVYVRPTEGTPPNPYLRVPDRDVVTTGGMQLTLMNPAYVLREMQQKFGNEYGIRSGLSSLKPF